MPPSKPPFPPELAALVEERPRLLAFIRRRVPSSLEPEDVLQRAFVRAIAKLDRLQDASRVRAWFYRIVRHEIADALVARAAHPEPAHTEGLLESVAAPERAPSDDDAACPCTAQLLRAMRPEYRDVLERVAQDDVSLNEVADTLGISANNAAVRLHRARATAREALREHCGVDTFRACLDCTCAIDHRCGKHSARVATR